LIPVPWIAPVLAPVLVSVALVTGGLILLNLKSREVRMRVSIPLWTLAVAGGGLVLVSFMLDFANILRQMNPSPFHWEVFAVGIGLGVIALALGVARLEHETNTHRPHQPIRT